MNQKKSQGKGPVSGITTMNKLSAAPHNGLANVVTISLLRPKCRGDAQ